MERAYMMRALELAEGYAGLTSPNPAVGAVIVLNDEIVGEGFHKGAGTDHAEVMALKSVAGEIDLSEAELYVTLEPCCHTGKTPPCTDAILRSGVKKVYVGARDSSKKVDGKGIGILREAGIDVVVADGELESECRSLIAPFLKVHEVGRPYVVLKAGISLDGKIATASGDSKWITCEEARADARLERNKCDAVLVGRGTVEADDPELAAWGKFAGKKLLRVILDSGLSLVPELRVFRDENVLVFADKEADAGRRALYKECGIDVVYLEDSRDMVAVLEELARREIQSVYVEGGAVVHGALLDLERREGGILDRILLYQAPVILGRDALSFAGGRGADYVKDALRFSAAEVEKIGDDLKILVRIS